MQLQAGITTLSPTAIVNGPSPGLMRSSGWDQNRTLFLVQDQHDEQDVIESEMQMDLDREGGASSTSQEVD